MEFIEIIISFKNNLLFKESFSLVNPYFESSDNVPDTLQKVFLLKV